MIVYYELFKIWWGGGGVVGVGELSKIIKFWFRLVIFDVWFVIFCFNVDGLILFGLSRVWKFVFLGFNIVGFFGLYIVKIVYR